ncbi:cystathionine gamma-synthase 1, chloroplastic-like [Impatiens glandulifera]|uniref:cystathionine gamma-synthase 1, chloroplastic-like n=1 Tax=Impatiens glandulifera TaxID=253017 RepID=UPI001FB14AF2|nr:cystathionine gamma-synthase 1, chloroplastic-like [Impatiens glandulifera]
MVFHLSSSGVLPTLFVRQLSIKARRNCSNIGVAQVVAASWSSSPLKSVRCSCCFYCSCCCIDWRRRRRGERLGRGIVTDAITTPVVNTSAYFFFKKTSDLIDFKGEAQ